MPTYHWVSPYPCHEAGSDRKLVRIWVICPAMLTAAMALYLFVVRNVHGWTFLPFGDEAGHLLGALALHAGDILYRDYIDAHGPVIFMLTQLYGVLSGWHDLTYARTISTVLATLAGLSIAFSPALRGVWVRLWATTLFFGLVGSVWILQALYMDSYEPVAGSLVVVGLSLFTAPSWMGNTASPLRAFICGACFALTCFTAYSLGPSVVLLAVSGLLPLAGPRTQQEQPGAFRGSLIALAFGGVAGSAIVLAWLAIFGDILGFIVYHIIINQIYYSRYIGFTFANFVQSFCPPMKPATIIHLIAVACFFIALIAFVGTALAMRRSVVRSLASIAIGFVGFALLNARGSTIFQDGTFLMTAIGAMAIGVPTALTRLGLPATTPRAWLVTGLVAATVASAEIAGRHAVATPSGFTRAQIVAAAPWHYGRQHNALYDEIRRIVKPDERILVLVYNPDFYLSAGRLPIKKYHAYLPWEADYAKSPWFGRQRNLCVDLGRSPPPIVYFDDWKVWDAYAPEQFMPCVIRILARKYVRQVEFPDLYVRRDPNHR